MGRPPANRPTDGELAILQVLWERGPSTVREVLEVLEGARPTAYTTVLKMLQIMADKGLVVRDESRRTHVYRARRAPGETQALLAGDLVDRAFDGSAAGLVMRALDSRPVSGDELAEIRRLLDELETSGGRGGEG